MTNFCTAHVPPQLRDSAPRKGRRHPPRADAARACQHPLHRDLHPSERASAPRPAPVAGRLLRRPLLTEGPAMKNNRIELADVVRQFQDRYVQEFGHLMMPSQKKALADIAACMTAEMGGHHYRCCDCDQTFWVYHGCRNRACPACHGRQMRAWLEAREAELLPCDYYHLVATVPEELRHLFLSDQKFMYSLLMKIVAGAVIDLARDRKYLGATPAILMVMHTWTGQLLYHPHTHLLVSGGGVTDGRSILARAARPVPGAGQGALQADRRKIPGRASEGQAKGLRRSATEDLEARVVLILQTLRARQAGRLGLPGPLRLPHRNHQHTDRRHGRHPRDLQVQAARHRRLGNVPTDGRRVPPPIPDARPAEGFS